MNLALYRSFVVTGCLISTTNRLPSVFAFGDIFFCFTKSKAFRCMGPFISSLKAVTSKGPFELLLFSLYPITASTGRMRYCVAGVSLLPRAILYASHQLRFPFRSVQEQLR